MKEIRVPILSGSFFDLQLFDFSFKDIKIIDIDSRRFDYYIKKLKAYPSPYLKKIKEKRSSYDKKYAIVKIHPNVDFNYADILNVWKILLIIFPSDLQIEHIIDFTFDNDGYDFNSISSWEKRVTGEYPGQPLYTKETDLLEVNDFIKSVFNRLNQDNYIGIAIENYLTSYNASHFHYQYLALCISLESIVYGSQELTYRLKRSVSILCGESPFNCNMIFNNINKIYKLRSEIIHGESYEITKVKDYLIPLKAIVSRTIIELLIHNIPSNKLLNEEITKIGYGDRNKISSGWKAYELNIHTFIETNWTELK
jgi:Apea-like HEPN